MADLGAGTSGYPAVLDTNPTPEDGTGAPVHTPGEGAIAAVIAIETELGTNPAGNKTDLVTRLAVSIDNDGKLVVQTQQIVNDEVSAALSTHIPFDDTIPQSTEGDAILLLAFTPKVIGNLLEVDAVVYASAGGAEHIILSLQKDTESDTLASAAAYVGAADKIVPIHLRYMATISSLTERTYRIRIGTASQSVVMNGIVTGPARRFGGVMQSSLKITEWQA
jgi:hypothetical protein